MAADFATRLATAATAEAASPCARVRDLGKTIDYRAILTGVSFDLPRAAFLALLGENGAGKSTLLRVLATLTHPSSGRLELFGQPVRHDSARLRARIGMIGHQIMLYRDLSALENLELFGRLYSVPRARRRAQELLEFVGLADRGTDAVKHLSRGMAQRVAIARALMHSPDLLLADEPFTGLDAPSAARLELCLTELHARGATIILANHDIAQSLRLAQRAIVLRRGRVALDRAAGTLDARTVLDEAAGNGGELP